METRDHLLSNFETINHQRRHPLGLEQIPQWPTGSPKKMSTAPATLPPLNASVTCKGFLASCTPTTSTLQPLPSRFTDLTKSGFSDETKSITTNEKHLPDYPSTAPADLFGSLTHYHQPKRSNYITTSMSLATRRQNQHMSAILATINGQNANNLTGDHYYRHTAGLKDMWRDIGDDGDALQESADMKAAFDRNLQTIYRMLETAKGIEAKPNQETDDVVQALQRDVTDHPKKRREGGLDPSEINRQYSVMPSFQPSSQLQPSSHTPAINTGIPQSTAVNPVDPNNSNLRALAGRKPMRVIMQDLAKRIQVLKTNPTEWEALETKIATYKFNTIHQTRMDNMNIVKINKQTAYTLFPEVKRALIATRRAKNEEHRCQVLVKKKRLDERAQIRKAKDIQQKEEISALHLLRDREGDGRTQAIQSRWFQIIIVASRVSAICTALETVRKEKLVYLKQLHAAIIIQREYRRYKESRLKQLQKASLRIISRCFKKFYPKWKSARLLKASDVIHSFFKEVYDTSKIKHQILKYRSSVVYVQKYTKSFLQIRQAQLKVIDMYWTQLSNAWLIHYSKDNPFDVDEKRAKKKKAKSKKEEAVAIEKALARISNDAKTELIFENLIFRRKNHRNALMNYKTALAAHHEDIKKRSYLSKDRSYAASQAIKRPIFKLLPSRETMFALMDVAFAKEIEKQSI
ncbi:hypothetical protein MT418_007787 [Batrachochytrium dendrobatidis]